MDCPADLDVTLGELGDELRMQLGGRRYPLGGSFELTERCNLRCLHCYINQPAGSQEAISRELTLPQVRSIMDQLADAGCLFMLLTGGEVMLRPDWQEVYRHIKQKGILISLFTNGTLVTPRIADFLAEYRPQDLEITLYGATQETYERVTGVSGSYARCMRGIELLMDRGLRLNLKSVLMRANHHELSEMQAIAESLGVHYRFDAALFPRLDGGQEPADHRLSPAEVVDLDREYQGRMQELADLYVRFSGVPARTENVFNCGAGRLSFHIDARGMLSLCMMARHQAYDLLKGSFREGWEVALASQLARQRTKDVSCLTCSAGVLCVQCPGWSQLAHGDDETPVDYICEIGHLRAAQIIPIAGSGLAKQEDRSR